MKPRKPFMIERNNEFAHISYRASGRVSLDNMRVTWVDWDGSRWATKEEAQIFLDDPSTSALFEGAEVIEVLEEIRKRIPAT